MNWLANFTFFMYEGNLRKEKQTFWALKKTSYGNYLKKKNI